MVTVPGVSHVDTIHSSFCPSTRSCLQDLLLADLSRQWRSQALSFRQAKIGVGRESSAVQRTCSSQTILRERGKIAAMSGSMNSVPRMHGTDELSETRNLSKTYTSGVNTHMYGMLRHEAIVVGISNARKRGQLFGVSHPNRRENTSSHYVHPGARVKYRAAALHDAHARAKCGGDLVVP